MKTLLKKMLLDFHKDFAKVMVAIIGFDMFLELRDPSSYDYASFYVMAFIGALILMITNAFKFGQNIDYINSLPIKRVQVYKLNLAWNFINLAIYLAYVFLYSFLFKYLPSETQQTPSASEFTLTKVSKVLKSSHAVGLFEYPFVLAILIFFLSLVFMFIFGAPSRSNTHNNSLTQKILHKLSVENKKLFRVKMSLIFIIIYLGFYFNILNNYYFIMMLLIPVIYIMNIESITSFFYLHPEKARSLYKKTLFIPVLPVAILTLGLINNYTSDNPNVLAESRTTFYDVPGLGMTQAKTLELLKHPHISYKIPKKPNPISRRCV